MPRLDLAVQNRVIAQLAKVDDAIRDDHMTDDERARIILNAIGVLANCMIPLSEKSNLKPQRAYLLGSISADAANATRWNWD